MTSYKDPKIKAMDDTMDQHTPGEVYFFPIKNHLLFMIIEISKFLRINALANCFNNNNNFLTTIEWEFIKNFFGITRIHPRCGKKVKKHGKILLFFSRSRWCIWFTVFVEAIFLYLYNVSIITFFVMLNRLKVCE